MQPLPRDFLSTIARKYALSEKQEEAFIELYNTEKNQQQVIESLHLSRSAFSNRMSGVYQKFSIERRTDRDFCD